MSNYTLRKLRELICEVKDPGQRNALRKLIDTTQNAGFFDAVPRAIAVLNNAQAGVWRNLPGRPGALSVFSTGLEVLDSRQDIIECLLGQLDVDLTAGMGGLS